MQIIEKIEAPCGVKGGFLMRIDFDFQPEEKPSWTGPGRDEEYTIHGASISVDGGATWVDVDDLKLDKRQLKHIVIDALERDRFDEAEILDDIRERYAA